MMPAGHFRSSPGGYFHGMVAKAKAGELNLARTIWGCAQVTGRLGRGARRAGRTDAGAGGRARSIPRLDKMILHTI
jgi:hypothetical protein